MSIDPRKYIEIDKRFPDSMAGDANRILTVKADESGYEHNPNVVMEKLVGTIIMWPLDTPPQGYLICDGAEYDVAAYPQLGALLGENAPGSGKFNVPDISFAKNSRGVNTGQIEPSSVGEHGHNIDPAPDHTHPVEVSGVEDHHHKAVEDHQHTSSAYWRDEPTGFLVPQGNFYGFAEPGIATGHAGGHKHPGAGAHNHPAKTTEAGGHPHKVHDHGVGQESQPTCTLVNFCIRT